MARGADSGGRGDPAALPRGALLLLGVVCSVFLALYVLPILMTARESFRHFTPGRVGGDAGTWTLEHYRALIEPAYLTYIGDTFRLSLVASVLGLVLAYPIALFIARRRGSLRTLLLGMIVSLLFLGSIVRAYAIALTLGPTGFLIPIARFLDLRPNALILTEATVVAGLLHVIVPMMALTLIGTINNINPRLAMAAESLGATRASAFFEVMLPLSARGLLSAFLIGYAISISSFVIPLVLGRGVVVFATNLIYARFADTGNFPSGAAIAVVMLVLSFGVVYGVERLASRQLPEGR